MMHRFLLIIALFLVSVTTSMTAAQDRPLLVPGKQTVFQRVLTRGTVEGVSEPGGAEVQSLPPFTPLYVYAHNGAWIHAGRGPVEAEFFVEAERTVDWRQNIVAAFTPPVERNRQLLMESEEALIGLLNHERVLPEQQRRLDAADGGRVDPDMGMNAVEPRQHVDIRQQFYVMPILDFQENMHPMSLAENLLLNVASLPEEANDPEDQSTKFEAGVVLVIDTTQSMQPYIDRTRDMLRRVIGEVGASDIGKRIHFGIVAFRDDTRPNPALEYRTRVVLPLERRQDNAAVIAALDGLRAARVPSPGYNEDSFAGLRVAIDDTDWAPGGNGYAGRYVILVTDAGPKLSDSPNLPPGTENNAGTLRIAAKEKSVGILTLHLQTPEGAGNHAFALSKYGPLSKFSGNRYVFEVPDGTPQAYEQAASGLLSGLLGHVRGEFTAAEAATDEERAIANLGRAMKLAWLGRTTGARAPDVISSWVSELAVENGTRVAFEPRLMVNKNELATMAEIVAEFVQKGEQIRSGRDAENFRAQIREAVLRMAANPARLTNAQAEEPGDVMEFLTDLPYRSRVLQISDQRWVENAMERRAVLDDLRPKLRQYRTWLQDPAVWTALYDGAPDGELVYAMPFGMLP